MGSLQSILKKFEAFDEVIISTYTRQILKGLEYLHSKNTIHRYYPTSSKSWVLGVVHYCER
jgi:serine/threonine protein kinase